MDISKMLFVVALAFLMGCSIASPIQKAATSESGFSGAVYDGENAVVDSDTSGAERYRIFHQAATGFVSVASIRGSAEKRADEFCNRKSKSAKALEEHTSSPPYILGNFPRIEIIFICL